MRRAVLALLAVALIGPAAAACSPWVAAVSVAARADCPGVDAQAVRCRDD